MAAMMNVTIVSRIKALIYRIIPSPNYNLSVHVFPVRLINMARVCNRMKLPLVVNYSLF